MQQKQCRWCLETFYTENHQVLYCSVECRHQYRALYKREYMQREVSADPSGHRQYRQIMRALREERKSKEEKEEEEKEKERRCAICDTVYYVRTRQLSLGCSIECRRKHRAAKKANTRRVEHGLEPLPLKEMVAVLACKVPVEKQCSVCQKVFTPSHHKIQHLSLVCSKRCRVTRKNQQKVKAAHPQIACKICNKMFMARSSRHIICSSVECNREYGRLAMSRRRSGIEKPRMSKEEIRARRLQRNQKEREERKKRFRERFGIL
jgi:hypothetical protein